MGMVNYLKNFANSRNGLKFYSDEFNNVIIKKEQQMEQMVILHFKVIQI